MFIGDTPLSHSEGTVITVQRFRLASTDPQHFSKNHFRTGPHTVITYHNVDQVGDGVDKRPDPLAVGLRIDGAGRRADGQTPRALLGVHLEEVNCPKQMLQAATLWEEGVPLEQLPCFFMMSTLVPKNSRKCRVSVVAVPTRWDAPGQCLVVGRLAGRDNFWWRQ